MRTVLDIITELQSVTDRHLTEYDRRGRNKLSRSYAEVHHCALAAGAAMRKAGIQAGDTVFLQLPNSLDLVECFLGAIAIGALPCCLAPPRALGGLEAYQQRLTGLFETFARPHLIAHEDTGSRSGQPYMLPPERTADTPRVELSEVDADQIAFIQLTSGTSRAPKAVKISHGALVANTLGILKSGLGQEGDAYASWLPLYHDMGLVGMLFCALASKSSLHMFRPETFVSRPMTWLKTIASIEGTAVVTAPNFAYQHCVNTLTAEDVKDLDLSRWRVAGCGAERVRPETLEEFTALFAPVGFKAEALVPCYGMAEATLAVTFDRGDHPPRIRDGQVSCGRPLPDTEIVIRDPDGREVAAGHSGEITVRGPGLCSGYTTDEVESPIRNGWLYTGDLGACHDGELYVTGRKKDLIIIDGNNIDPDEVEAVADQITRTPGGRCGAFATEVEGREQVALIVEVPAKAETQFPAWGDAIGNEAAILFGFRLHDLIFVNRGDLPTTSSGKVRRAQLREFYEANQLNILWRQDPRDIS